MELEKVFFFVVLVEAVIQNLKLIYDSKKFQIKPDVAVSLVVSVAACVFFEIDLFKMYTFNSLWQPLGSVFTGVIISRGAGFVHDIFETVLYQSFKAAYEKDLARVSYANKK
jgi:hypothetical protein